MNFELALEQLRHDIHSLNSPDCRPERIQRFHFVELQGHLHIEFYGDAMGEAYARFLDAVSREPIASAMGSLRMGGPDTGANGTRNWDLRPLANAAGNFPNLRHLRIEQGSPVDHNRTIVGAAFDEGGVLAETVKRAPNMVELTTPSAPNGDFFRVGLPSLSYLNVDAGYDTQEFILNLAGSNCFPELRCLEWGEYCESYMDDWRERCTPFACFQALFCSEAFRTVRRFVFKNPVCSRSELVELKSMRPDLQLLVVRSTSEYVSS